VEIIIAVGIFLGVVLFIEGFFYLIELYRKPEEKRVHRRLRTLTASGYRKEEVDILRKTVLSSIPWFNKLLFRVPNVLRMSRFLEQADARFPVGLYILVAVLLAPLGYLAGNFLHVTFPLKVLLAAAAVSTPFIYLFFKRRKRMMKFEEQLPDALDMIGRSLRAGHAFSGGLKMVADEFADPIGVEFEKTLNEINFGIGIPEALKSMTRRVDCPDLKFFVISVIIQRETGGNLAEVMENLAYLIRERFKLHGRVQVLTSEGRFSAVVLLAIPFLVALYFYMVQPRYIQPLFTDPVGRKMVTSAIIMMILGSLIMKRMVRIKV